MASATCVCRAQDASQPSSSDAVTLTYRPEPGTVYDCTINSKIKTVVPPDLMRGKSEEVELDFNWTIEVLKKDEKGNITQTQTLKSIEFTKDGEPYYPLNRSEFIVLGMLKDNPINATLSPFIDLNDVEVPDESVNTDYPEFRQFVSYNYAAVAYPSEISSIHTGDTWTRNIDITVPGVSSRASIPVLNTAKEIFEQDGKEYILVSGVADKKLSFRDYVVPSTYVSDMDVTIRSETWITLDNGVPEYNTTTIEMKLNMIYVGKKYPIEMNIQTNQYVDKQSK